MNQDNSSNPSSISDALSPLTSTSSHDDFLTSPIKPASQKPKGLIATTIVTSVLAIVSIAGAIYFFIDANNKSADNANLRAKIDLLQMETSAEFVETEQDNTIITEVVAQPTINNAMAQNIIRPYIQSFNYQHNILDYNFDDAAKITVAFQNLPIMYVFTKEGNAGNYYTTAYSSLNSEYQRLFGNDQTLAKTDYQAGHADSFYYKEGSFEIYPFNGGGAGGGMFTVVKSATINNNNLSIEVYHDRAPICEAAEDDYCVDAEGAQGFVVESIEQFNMKSLIDKYSNQIPVYKMTFVKNDGHYVLSAVEKE